MSTFNGVMSEFPDIRVDYFRAISHRPPLACFLTHVHSDHLAGLDSLQFKSSFIYCSAATKEILLRLERYLHRMNFNQGILEARKQTYKHLKHLLKPIPLETPTRIELEPGNEIQVTLFDANHCTGAVIFLFESDSNAVLYTGDIRSEPWFVNSLTRNPFLIEYTSGLKTLDCIYLDTSNLDPVVFPTKAQGLGELLQKMSQYPPDTIFHFTAWTFGYEEVWMAVAKFLKSQIHVDPYKLRLYQCLLGSRTEKDRLSGPFIASEGPVLAGYKCGNTPQAGCLTDNTDCRIHSCEKGMHCSSLKEKTVWVRPIITRTKDGRELDDIGVGGGGGDLTQRPELELDSIYDIDQLMGLFGNTEDLVAMDFKRRLLTNFRSARRTISLDDMGFDHDQDELPIIQMTKAISKRLAEKRSNSLKDNREEKGQGNDLPKVITFPYSRHSSYDELCHLVRVFQPKDVYPCTVDEESWHEGLSMRAKFGRYCSTITFRHDFEMSKLLAERHTDGNTQQTQTTNLSEESQLVQVNDPQEPSPRNAAGKQLQRNSPGHPRPFDPRGKEMPVTPKPPSRNTPPRYIFAISPGSESQSLRRKCIEGDFREHSSKRARFQNDGHSSLQSLDNEKESQLGAQTESYLFSSNPESSNESQYSNTPDSEDFSTDIISTPTPTPKSPPFSAFLDENGNEITYDDDPAACDSGYMLDDTYFDAQDQIQRCKLCGHELWRPFEGFCTGCEEGSSRSGVPYFEIISPGAGPGLKIVANENVNVSPDDRKEVAGDYLDVDSSAYDSHDEAGCEFKEEYEVNSFIDDDSQEGSEDGDRVSSSDETSYKKRYHELQATHQQLIGSYCDLQNMCKELRGDFISSDDDSDADVMNQRNAEGAPVVNVAAPDLVTDILLSQAREQSQNSEISAERIRDRAIAYEAVINEDNRGWHSISLVSTHDNHTHPEIEL